MDSHKTVSANHSLFEEKGEPKRYRTEVLPLTSLPPLPLGQTGSHEHNVVSLLFLFTLEFLFLRLIGLFDSKCNRLQLRCVNRTVVSQFRSTRQGAVLGSWWHCCSSNLLMRFRAVSQCLHVIWLSGCYFWKGLVVCGVFFLSFFFFLSETYQRLRLAPRRSVWHCGVIDHI